PAGIELVKLQVKTVALNRSFDESKESIRGRMARERRSKEYDEWMKRLRESTKVAINDDELSKVQVEGAPPMPQSMIPGANAMNPLRPPVQPAPPPAAAAKIGGNEGRPRASGSRPQADCRGEMRDVWR